MATNAELVHSILAAMSRVQKGLEQGLPVDNESLSELDSHAWAIVDEVYPK